MERHGFSPSKSFGQNFLIDPAVPEKIAAGAAPDRETSVLEIGPGIGALTRALSARSGEVFALEVDRSLEPVLRETLSELSNTSVIFGDILKTDIRKFAADSFSFNKTAAVSNLPYNITTKAVTALLEARVFGSVTLMLQREAARKITACPGDADRCLFGVVVNHYATPSKLFSVPAGSFYPAPKVDSVVLRLEAKPPFPTPEGEKMFLAAARAVFSNRRKTILNNIAAAFCEVGKDGAERFLKRLKIDPGRRGESLTLEELYGISGELMQIIQSI